MQKETFRKNQTRPINDGELIWSRYEWFGIVAYAAATSTRVGYVIKRLSGGWELIHREIGVDLMPINDIRIGIYDTVDEAKTAAATHWAHSL